MPLYSTTECKNKHSIPCDFQNLAPPNSTIFIWLSNYFPVILSVIEMFNFSEVARNTLILSEQPEVARNTLILSEQPEAAHIWNWWAFWFSWWPWHLTTHSRTPRLNKSQALTQLSQRATLYYFPLPEIMAKTPQWCPITDHLQVFLWALEKNLLVQVRCCKVDPNSLCCFFARSVSGTVLRALFIFLCNLYRCTLRSYCY